jgi:hypothetical protein
MGAYKGIVTNPFTKKKVEWVLAPGLAALGKQLDALGITWYSIGNADHLDNRPAGAHTPWKTGTNGKTVTAIDVMKSPYADVEKRILKLMRTDDYDTTWIQFINVNGSQYDYAGRRLQSSGDHHLHLEIKPKRTSFTSNLFYDMFGKPTPKAK